MQFVSPAQEDIVRCDARVLIIEGCAGSRKTDSLIKRAAYYLATPSPHKLDANHGILFLTMVGSVTSEIQQRLESALDIKIKKVGESNHFAGSFDGIPICVANFDAWILLMIRHHRIELGDLKDNDFPGKSLLVMEISRTLKLTTMMKTHSGRVIKVGLFLGDEIQDISQDQMRLLVNMTNQNPELDICVAGDYLQTLFEKPKDAVTKAVIDSKEVAHVMSLFRTLPGCVEKRMNINFRCPGPHVQFNNFLLRDCRRKYGIPDMEYVDDESMRQHKPVLFTHWATTGANMNAVARINAEMVTNMLRTVMRTDAEITPGTVVVIMPVSNQNPLFYQLEDTFAALFKELGYTGQRVTYMETYGDGYHKALDWSKVNDHAKMLSVAGDKGKAHKVVFFLGFTEWSIPRLSEVGTPDILRAESLLNVATTRSEKYCFIGFVGSNPSRFLAEAVRPPLPQRVCHKCDLVKEDVKSLSLNLEMALEQLAASEEVFMKYAYLGWKMDDDEYMATIPEQYRLILRSQSIENLEQQREDSHMRSWRPQAYPHFYSVFSTLQKVGSNTQLKISTLSRDMGRVDELLKYTWLENASTKVFGKPQILSAAFEELHYVLLGRMSELLLRRSNPLMREHLFDFFKESFAMNDAVWYTNDERVLTCWYDYKNMNTFSSIKAYIRQLPWYYRDSKNENNKVVEELRKASEAGAMFVVNSSFQKEAFRSQLSDFLLSSNSNQDLSKECVWNVTLLHNQLTCNVYRPSVNTFVNHLTDELTEMHENIEYFANLFSEGMGCSATATEFEREVLTVTGVVDETDVRVIKEESGKCVCALNRSSAMLVSLSGIPDMFDPTTGTLIEIKASKRDECSEEWIIQTILYAVCLRDLEGKDVRRICIVNLRAGCLWEWSLEKGNLPDLPSLMSIVKDKLAVKYDWHRLQTDTLVEEIERRMKQNESITFSSSSSSCSSSSSMSNFKDDGSLLFTLKSEKDRIMYRVTESENVFRHEDDVCVTKWMEEKLRKRANRIYSELVLLCN